MVAPGRQERDRGARNGVRCVPALAIPCWWLGDLNRVFGEAGGFTNAKTRREMREADHHVVAKASIEERLGRGVTVHTSQSLTRIDRCRR
jgi:hypothetical protein